MIFKEDHETKKTAEEEGGGHSALGFRGRPGGERPTYGEHGLTTEEVEDVLLNPDNPEDTSDSSGCPIVFGPTRTGRYIAVVYEIALDDPLMLHVTTAFDVEP